MANVASTVTRPFALTDDELAAFDRDGFLVLRGRIPQPMIERLRAAADAWVELGHRVGSGDLAREDAGDWLWADRPHGRAMWRVDYVHSKGQAASLELLGCPELLGIAESLCGPDFVPTYESLVFKAEGDGEAVPWHQDAVHPRRHRIANIDVYLDPSRVGGGALRVVPRSQTAAHDVCRLRDDHGWDPPDVVQVEMEPGDVLVHDVMVVHGSERVQGNSLRRTLYYEFRPVRQILDEGPWDRDWVDARLRLVPLGLQAYAARHPAALAFDWRIAPELRPGALGDPAEELRVAHLVHTPGSYCSASAPAR